MTQPQIQQINPPTLPEATPTFTHGVVAAPVRRVLFVSGQVAWSDESGAVPANFDSQCRLVWGNVLAVLTEAGMEVRHLAKVTAFLSDRDHREAFGRIRAECLGDHCPAITIIIADIYSEHWLLEIEAIAVA